MSKMRLKMDSTYYAPTFDFGRDVDGAYTAQPYFPAREASEIRRWEEKHGEPWNHPADEIMAGEMPIGVAFSNRGHGPSWSDVEAWWPDGETGRDR